MTPGLLIYLGGAAVVFIWLLSRMPGSHKSLVLLNGAFWPAMGWPIFALGFAINVMLKWLIPDKSDRGTI